MLNLFRNGAVGLIDWLDGRRDKGLRVMGRFPNLALAQHVAIPPAFLRQVAAAAVREWTNAVETNRKGADKT